MGLPETFESGIHNGFEAPRTFILLIFLLPLKYIFLKKMLNFFYLFGFFSPC